MKRFTQGAIRPFVSAVQVGCLAMVLASAFLSTQALAYDAAWNGYKEDISRAAPEPEPPCKSGQCPLCPNPNSTKSPVYTADGSLVWTDRDISFSGTSNIGLKRTYNSVDYRAGLFGRGWVTAQESNIARTWRAVTEPNADGSSKVATEFASEPIWMSSYGRRYVLEESQGQCGTPEVLPFTFEKLNDGSFKQVFEGSKRFSIYSEHGLLLQEYSDIDGSTVYYEYDDQQSLIHQYDSYGFELYFTYNDQGFVSEVADQADRTWIYSYDDYGRLTQVVDPDGNSRDYGYRQIDNIGYSQHLLTSVDDNVDDPTLRVTWGNITINPNYSPAMRVTSYTESDGRRHDYSYSYTTYNSKPATKVTKTTKQVGSSTTIQSQTFIADADNYLVVSEVNSTDNYTISTTYNEKGKVIDRRDKRGNLSEYTYDEHGRRTQTIKLAQTDDARITTYTYEGDSDRIATINMYGILETSYTYDSDRRPLTKTEVDLANDKQRVWKYSYHPNSIDAHDNTILGKIASIDGPQPGSEDTVSLEYNSQGLVEHIIYPLGQSVSYRYDSIGQLISVTDPNSIVTAMSYDSKGRLLQTVRNNRTIEYSYNGQGQVTELVDEMGGVYRLAYNEQNRLMEVVYPTGDYLNLAYSYQAGFTEVNSSFYSADGSLLDRNIQREEPLSQQPLAGYLTNTGDQIYQNQYNGLDDLTSSVIYGQFGDTSTITTSTTEYNYDQLGRMTRTVNGLNGITEFAYDIMDRLVQVTDPNNGITTYQYNGWGDAYRLESPDSGVSTFEYDASGNQTSQSNANNIQTGYAYDAQNRITAIDYQGTDVDVSLTYDEGPFGAGRLTSVADGSGSNHLAYNEYGQIVSNSTKIAGLQFSTEYQYDTIGQMVGISYPSGLNINYSHDDFGRLIQIENRTGTTSQNIIANVDWRAMQISSSLLGNGLVAERRYDSSGRLVEKRYGSGYTSTCSLDNQGSVVRQDRVMKGEAGTAVFQYDKAGHLITDADTASSEDLFFTYDTIGNRLTRQSSAGSVNEIYTYQQNGNRLQGIDAIAIEYDAAGNILNDGIRSFRYNTMNRLAEANHSQLKIPAYYTYNYLGQRVRKQLSDGQGTDIRYVYGQSGELLGEYDASGNRIREYVYFPNGNIQELVAQIEADGSLTYIHTDHLATPRSATNQSQTIVWSWLSDAFGEAAPNEDVDSDGVLVTVNQRFPGQYFDNETGLHYNWHRFYDPETGRYMSADPIGLGGGINLFAYVQNNPVNLVDPWGLFGQGGPNSSYPGHNDFSGGSNGGGRFDYSIEDEGDTSPWVDPERHFRPLGQSERDVQEAINQCNEDAFRRAMHRGQDYFSHYEKGYRWAPFQTVTSLGFGHLFDGTTPDEDPVAWFDAETWSYQWNKKWKEHCECKNP